MISVSRVQFGVPWESVKDALTPYGTIDRARRDSLNNISTGTISILMQLNRPIPSKITVASRTCFVFYRGQPRTCFKCGESGHQKNNCPRNATRTDTTSGLASTSTWGDQHPEGDIAVVTTNPHADSLTTSTATASTEQIHTAHLILSADQPLGNKTTLSTTSTAITLPVDNPINTVPLVNSLLTTVPRENPASDTQTRTNSEDMVSTIEPLSSNNDSPNPLPLLEPIDDLSSLTENDQMDLSAPLVDNTIATSTPSISSLESQSTSDHLAHKNTPKPISITPKQLTTMRQSSQKTGVKRLLSQQSTTSTIKGPWVRKSTKPSIPPNPKCTNSFGILADQPNTDLEEDMSDEEIIPALPDSDSMEDSSTEESSGEESEEEYTPILDKVTGDLITKKKPTGGPTIPNAPLLSSEYSEHTNG